MSVTEEQTTTESPELTDDARTAIEQLVAGVLKEEATADRSEVRRAWQQRAFKNGIQHIWYDSGSHCYMLPQASGAELPRFMDVYNIYTPHWRSFVSLLSQNPPGIDFVPEDLQEARDVTAAAYAEKMRHRVDRMVHMKDRQMEASGLFCTDGRTIARTFVDADGKLRVTLHGVLESKCPAFVRKMERWGYCVLSEEVDVYAAKDEFPDFADDIETTETGAQADYRRYARLMVLSNRKGGFGAGDDGLSSVATRHEAWIRPARYRKAPKDVQDELKSLYPEGFRATVISGTCVQCVPETMESALRVEWPSPGQGQIRPSMLHDLVPIQEAFNDILNMIREHGEYSIPARWVSDTVDSEAIAEQISAPGVTHQITVPAQASISDLVFIEPTPTLPAELIANADRLLQLAEMTTGDYASLQGEGDPHSETYAGQKMLSDQAKGQLSAAWAGMQWLFAGVYEIAVRLAAQMSPEETAVQGNAGQDRFNPAAILDGQFGCYPDTDSSFPETMADKRASLQNVLGQLGQAGPQGQGIVMQPDNLKLVKQYSGLTDLIIPGAEARDKQLEEIEQLLVESPLPPDPEQNPQAAAVFAQAMIGWQQQAAAAAAQKQPEPPTPIVPGMRTSVDVDPAWDYHAAEADKVQEWLSSRACREEQRKGNQKGIENVKLHGQAHKDELAKQQAGQQAKPEQPKVSLTMQITDPTTIAQFAAAAGATATTPEDIAASQIPDQREQAAKTQHVAAQAQHQAVLAAKEAVAPVKSPNAAPEIEGKEK